MLIERRLRATAEVQGLKGRIWNCQDSFACPFPSLTCSLPIKDQAAARYWRGKNDELSMFEIIITVSMATRKCPPWLLFVFWARRHEVKVCKQKAAGRDAGRGLCGTLPTILTHFRHTWLLLVCGAFFRLASAVGCNFGFGLLLGCVRDSKRAKACAFPDSSLLSCSKVVTCRTQCPLVRICGSEPHMLLRGIPPLCTITGSPYLTLQGSPSTSSDHGGWVNPHFHRILILPTNSLGRKMQCNWNHFGCPSPALHRETYLLLKTLLVVVKLYHSLSLTVTAQRYLIGFYYYSIPGSMWSSNTHLLRHLRSLVLVGDAFKPFKVLSGGLKKEGKRGGN